MKAHFILLALGLCLHNAMAEDAPPPGSPLIDHAPVTTVLRGQPAHIVANIKAQDGAAITSVTVFVRITDAGKPFEYRMSGGPGDGAYATDVPVSLLRAVQRFWYHVEAWDSKGRVSDTLWLPVNVLDGASAGGGAGAGLFSSRNLLIAGGVLLAGGGAALIIDNNNDGGGDDPPPPAPTPTPKPVKKSKPKSSNDGSNDPTPPAPPPVPPCVTTGSEAVNYIGSTLDPHDAGNPIELYVCGACSNASIRVVGSWGAETSAGPYSNPTCDPGAVIQLGKPRAAPPADSQTIEVYSNGALINSITWPSGNFF